MIMTKRKSFSSTVPKIKQPVPSVGNLFPLQIKELLKETHSNANYIELDAVKERIQATPKLTTLKLDDLQCPVPISLPAKLSPFTFQPPVAIHEIGSEALGIGLRRPHATLDLALEVPMSCLGPKDFRDNRFLYKRLVYLGCVAKHLRGLSIVRKVEWCQKRDQRRPVLEIRFQDSDKNPILSRRIRIDTVVESKAFKLHRFRPDRANLRFSTYPQTSDLPTGVDTGSPATPMYNTAMLEEICAPISHRFLMDLFEDVTLWKQLKKGVVLLKIWLKQRRLYQCAGGFSGHLIALLVAKLLIEGSLTQSMTPIQVFKRILTYFTSEAKWTAEGVYLRSVADVEILPQEDPQQLPSMEIFHAAYPVVFVGPSGYDNVAASMTKATFDWIAYEAERSLKLLALTETDIFNALFMTPVVLQEQFDHLIVVHNPDVFRPLISKYELESHLNDNHGSLAATVLSRVCDLLKKCLDKRLVGLHVDLKSLQDVNTLAGPLIIGLILEASLVTVSIDKGPQSGPTTAAREFRQLWGSKTEMRHLDGDLRECLVWNSPLGSVTTQIINYVFHNLLGVVDVVCKSSLGWHQVSTNPLAPVLYLPNSILPTTEPRDPQEITGQLSRTADDLCALLRGLNASLPLDVTGVRSVSAAARGTAVFPSLPIVPYRVRTGWPPLFTPFNHLVVSLELSGKWPNDLEMFLEMKKLFLIRMHTLLQEEEVLSRVHQSLYLDVYMGGFLFRVHLGQAKQAYLMRVSMPSQMSEGPDALERDSPEARAWDRLHLHLPHTVAVITGLVQQWPETFPTTCRVAKRWLTSHGVNLLSSLPTTRLQISDTALDPSVEVASFALDEIAVELMVAHVFLNPQPYSTPCSSLTAFLRFLRLLWSHDWNHQPLVINFNNQLTLSEIEELSESFQNERDQRPSMVLITPLDRQGVHWTGRGPSANGLKELRELAKQAHTALTLIPVMENKARQYKAVFRPDLTQFDVVLTLSRRALAATRHQCLDLRSSKSHPGDANKRSFHYVWPREKMRLWPLGLELDPVDQLGQAIRSTYSEECEVRYNRHGASWMGLKWTEEKKCSGPTPAKRRRKEEKDDIEVQVRREFIVKSIVSNKFGFITAAQLIEK